MVVSGQLYSVPGNNQRLDGGAMFGNVPQVLWARWMAPDEQNRISLACRALLWREADRHVLFETGIGAFFPPKLRARFGVLEPNHVLLDNLRALGLEHEDIDVVVLSHLHFDHAGGMLSAYREGEEPSLLFPNARYVVGQAAWERAQRPHARDRASFIPELNAALASSGRLEVVAGERSSTLGDRVRFHTSHGHTPGLLLAEIDARGGPIVFAADLIPGAPWVHLPITMGYDRYPELLIDEKRALLEDLVSRGGRLYFTHDPEVALATVVQDNRGRFSVQDPHQTLTGMEI